MRARGRREAPKAPRGGGRARSKHQQWGRSESPLVLGQKDRMAAVRTPNHAGAAGGGPTGGGGLIHWDVGFGSICVRVKFRVASSHPPSCCPELGPIFSWRRIGQTGGVNHDCRLPVCASGIRGCPGGGGCRRTAEPPSHCHHYENRPTSPHHHPPHRLGGLTPGAGRGRCRWGRRRGAPRRGRGAVWGGGGPSPRTPGTPTGGGRACGGGGRG